MIVLPTAYFGPISHFALISHEKEYFIEKHETFCKQTYRNRCEISGPNGMLKLVVPVCKWHHRTTTADIKISYEEDWQSRHWKSICSAYLSSPYFEFYEEEVYPLFQLNEEFLIDYNLRCERKLKALLDLTATDKYTTDYKIIAKDYRQLICPKRSVEIFLVEPKPYIQVFSNKFNFQPNLSILDLLFNLGPNSKHYLQNLSLR